MVTLKFDMTPLGSSSARQFTLQFGRHVTNVNGLIKTRYYSGKSSPLATLDSHSDSCFFLRYRFTNTQVGGKSTVRTNTSFIAH
jgi:hypothetical protein